MIFWSRSRSNAALEDILQEADIVSLLPPADPADECSTRARDVFAEEPVRPDHPFLTTEEYMDAVDAELQKRMRQ